MNFSEQKITPSKSTKVILIAAIICLISICTLTFKELYTLKYSYSWINHTFEVENEINQISYKINEFYIYKLENTYNHTKINNQNTQFIIKSPKKNLDNVINLTVDNIYQQKNAAYLSSLVNDFYSNNTNKNIEIFQKLHKKIQQSISKMLLEEQQLLLKRQVIFKKRTKNSLLLFLIVVISAISIFVFSYLRLIANRKKLRKTQAFLRGLLASTDNIISYFSPVYNSKKELVDFRVAYTNEDIKNVIGENFSQIKGKLISEVYPTLFTSGVFEIYKLCVKNPGQLENYVRDFNFTGEDVWFDSSVVELNGGVVISSKNITKLKVSEQKLKKLNKQLTTKNEALVRSNEALESFSRVASHDLQEPLRKIQIFVSRIFDSEEESLSSSGKKYLVKTRDSADRMQNLIKNLLSYSRVNRRDARLINTNLNTIIKEVKKEFDELLIESGAKVKSTYLPKVKGIPFELEQLFSNLISNSIKYRELSRPLVIGISSKITPASSVPEQVPIKGISTYHCVEITDNGIGFDKENSHHIFEIFQRLHGKGEYSGYGIGLSICKKIMHFHQGYISAYAEKNKGATFQLYFPVSKID